MAKIKRKRRAGKKQYKPARPALNSKYTFEMRRYLADELIASGGLMNRRAIVIDKFRAQYPEFQSFNANSLARLRHEHGGSETFIATHRTLHEGEIRAPLVVVVAPPEVIVVATPAQVRESEARGDVIVEKMVDGVRVPHEIFKDEGVETPPPGVRVAMAIPLLDDEPAPPKRSGLQKIFAALAPAQCRWIIGDPRDKWARVCKSPALPKRPYCDVHHKLAHVPAPKSSVRQGR